MFPLHRTYSTKLWYFVKYALSIEPIQEVDGGILDVFPPLIPQIMMRSRASDASVRVLLGMAQAVPIPLTTAKLTALSPL
jgi:hypothetical protein